MWTPFHPRVSCGNVLCEVNGFSAAHTFLSIWKIILVCLKQHIIKTASHGLGGYGSNDRVSSSLEDKSKSPENGSGSPCAVTMEAPDFYGIDVEKWTKSDVSPFLLTDESIPEATDLGYTETALDFNG